MDERLQPGLHEVVAGAVLREAGRSADVEPHVLLGLVRSQHERGFASPGWRNDAAFAMSALASRADGLPEEDVERLEAWLERDDQKIERQHRERLSAQAESDRRNARPERDRPARAFLFGSHGGLRAVPQRNFTILSAIRAGLLGRPGPEWARLARVLSRHVEEPEDPVVWTQVLLSNVDLFWQTGVCAEELFEAIANAHPDALDDVALVSVFWKLRGRVPPAVVEQALRRWLDRTDDLRQAAGEYMAAVDLVEPDGEEAGLLSGMLTGIWDGEDKVARTGALFSCTEAWRAGDDELRRRAHGSLMCFVGSRHDGELQALAGVFMGTHSLEPDELTREVLGAVAGHPALLRVSLACRMLDKLEDLLVQPGFDEPVLRALEAIVRLDDAAAWIAKSGFGSRGDMVQMAVALQRNDGRLRAGAMDVYERLLDAEAAGAAAAADDALRA